MPRSKLDEHARTIRAQWLGEQMRQLRERRRLTLKDAGEYLGRDLSAVSRYELAEWPFKRFDVMALLDLYAVHDEEQRRVLVELADQAWRTDHWDSDGSGKADDGPFVDRQWLEAHARLIGIYCGGVIRPPLQAAGYAHAWAKLRTGLPVREGQIEREIERQRDLLSGPTRVSVVIDEVGLRRRLGGPDVMTDQLRHLANVAEYSNVEVLVLPMAAPRPWHEAPFWVFAMPENYPEVAMVEGLVGTVYVETPRSKRFVRAYEELRLASLSRSDSAEMISKVAKELTTA